MTIRPPEVVKDSRLKKVKQQVAVMMEILKVLEQAPASKRIRILRAAAELHGIKIDD